MRKRPSGVRRSPRLTLSPTGCCPNATRYVRTTFPRWNRERRCADFSTTMLSAGKRLSSDDVSETESARDAGAEGADAADAGGVETPGFVMARALSAWPTSVSATVPTRNVSVIVAGHRVATYGTTAGSTDRGAA